MCPGYATHGEKLHFDSTQRPAHTWSKKYLDLVILAHTLQLCILLSFLESPSERLSDFLVTLQFQGGVEGSAWVLYCNQLPSYQKFLLCELDRRLI